MHSNYKCPRAVFLLSRFLILKIINVKEKTESVNFLRIISNLGASSILLERSAAQWKILYGAFQDFLF